MATNVPIDVLIHVFDHLDRRIDGRGAAATCRSWNAAWYMSRHWCGDTNDKEVAIPTLRARNADAAIRALTKTGWRATRIALEAVDAALATDVVGRFLGLGRGLESVSTLFASPRHVDATAFLLAAAAGPSVPSGPLVPSVPSVPSGPRSLLVHANTSWTYDHRIFNFCRGFAALEHLSIARCTSSVHASSLPPSLRSLEAIECDMLIFDVDLGKLALEDLTLIDCGGYPIRLRIGQQQQHSSLQTVRVRDTTVELDFFADRTVRIKPTDSYSMTFEANMLEWRNEDLKFFVHRRSNATTTIDIAAEELHYFLVDPRRTYAFHVGRRDDDDVVTIRNVIL